METLILELLTSGGTHGLLVVALIVLWRENRRLVDRMEKLQAVTASVHALTLLQNKEIEAIKAQTQSS